MTSTPSLEWRLHQYCHRRWGKRPLPQFPIFSVFRWDFNTITNICRRKNRIVSFQSAPEPDNIGSRLLLEQQNEVSPTHTISRDLFQAVHCPCLPEWSDMTPLVDSLMQILKKRCLRSHRTISLICVCFRLFGHINNERVAGSGSMNFCQIRYFFGPVSRIRIQLKVFRIGKQYWNLLQCQI